MIELLITQTGKSFSPRDTFKTFNIERKHFASLSDAETWIKEQHGKAKKRPMFVDTKDGKPQRIGYIIGFRTADYSHAPVEHWLQRDWIEFREVNQINLDEGVNL